MSAPRDWDKELAAIDRAIERAPVVTPPATRAQSTGVVRGSAAAAWTRLTLVLTLAVALPFWPYQADCGGGLTAHLAALGALFAAGGWAAASAWRHRRPVAHVLALAAMAWAGVLAAGEILPRVGYARGSAAWRCHGAS